MRHMVPAFEFRRRAREAMKTMMPILLVVALIAALPSLVSNTVTALTKADPSQLLTDLSNRLMQVSEKHGIAPGMNVDEELVLDEVQLITDILGVYDVYMTDATAFFEEKGLIILGLSVMVLVASPVLTLGMINALLHALRRKPFTAGIALSRLRYVFKALGLELLVALKICLWVLPGLAVMIAGFALPETLSGLVVMIGAIAMIALAVMAAYRYALASFVLADEPQTRVTACIRRSCEVMKRRKLELFSLELSFIGWSLLLGYVQMMLNGLGPVLGMALGMFASLFLTVYTNCAMAAFYQEYAVGPLPAPETEAEAAPADDTLDE